MNPLHVLKNVVPALKDVLESIHAHLELMVEEQKKTNQHLAESNEKLTEVIDILNDTKGKE